MQANPSDAPDMRSIIADAYEAFRRHPPPTVPGNAFAHDLPEFQDQLRSWMLNPDHRRRFGEKLLTPDFLHLAKHNHVKGSVDFDAMLEAALHHLAG